MESQYGRYRIEGEIGSGGMATVYRAFDTVLERPVALKILQSESLQDPGFVERFRREATTAARLQHPHIVTVYDVGQEQGQYFVAMEYVPGSDLRRLLEATGPLTPGRAADILDQVASALDYSHRQGVIHGHVKPTNLLIEPGGQVKLTDFGISQAPSTAVSLTATRPQIGARAYMSPEQADGLPVDARSDVYSLGIVAYEVLAGAVPFGADTTSALLDAHVHKPGAPLRTRVPGLSPELESVLLRALAKRPDDRYQTAGAFAQAFRQAIAGDGRPPEPLVRGRDPKPVPTRRTLIILSCAALALLLGAYLLGKQLLAGRAAPAAMVAQRQVIETLTPAGGTEVSPTGSADEGSVESATFAPPSITVEPAATHTLAPIRSVEPTITAIPTFAAGPTPSPIVEPSADATLRTTTKPTSTPTPLHCATPVDAVFSEVWERGGGARAECPLGPAYQRRVSFQPFQHGFMLWRASPTGDAGGHAYVLFDSGRWQDYPDQWQQGMPESAGYTPPVGLKEPRFGFGLVWSSQLGGPNAEIGWAIEDETGSDFGLVQDLPNNAALFRFPGQAPVFMPNGKPWIR